MSPFIICMFSGSLVKFVQPSRLRLPCMLVRLSGSLVKFVQLYR